MHLPQLQDLGHVGFLLFTSKRSIIMDFEGFFTNAGDNCCNAKAARFILKVAHLFVSIPYLSPLLLLFGQISIVYFQFRQ